MNQSELQSVWTRMLDGEPLSSEEITALNAFLADADAADSQWLTDDFTTDVLLRALSAQESAEALSAEASSQFVRRVQEQIAAHQTNTPVVTAPPVVLPPSLAGDSERRSHSMSPWIIAATAASILLVATMSVVWLLNQNALNDLAKSAPKQQSPTGVPQPVPQIAESSPPGEDPITAQNLSPKSIADAPTQSDRQPTIALPSEYKPPIQIALDPPSDADDQRMLEPKSPQPVLGDRTPSDSASLAAVLQSDEAVWREGYELPTDLLAGPLELLSGSVRLRLAKGTELTLSGPTKLELVDDNRVSLKSGLITANVPAAAIGFEVQAPGGRVVDLGTRFTVDANPAEKFTLVTVIDGTVDVIQPPVNPRARQRKSRLTTGRMKWLPVDAGQAFDWRLLATFGDEAIKPGHVQINGEAFDVRFPDQYQAAKERLTRLFSAASEQRKLVARGERFSGLLIVDDVRQIVTTENRLSDALAKLVERVDQRQKKYRLLTSPEELLNEIQNRLRSQIGNP